MRFDFAPTRCLLCRSREPDSWEHVLPSYVGGRLQVRVLCTKCNSVTGAKLVSQLKWDPGIRLAAESLAPRIPALYDEMKIGWRYVAWSTLGHKILNG